MPIGFDSGDFGDGMAPGDRTDWRTEAEREAALGAALDPWGDVRQPAGAAEVELGFWAWVEVERRVLTPEVWTRWATVEDERVDSWQEFMFAIAFIQSDDWRTLPVGIALMNSVYGVSYTYLMAAAVIVTIPVVVLFAFLQRYLIRGLTAGAVKG